MKFKLHLYCAIALLCLSHYICSGINITGVIVDAQTQQPLPFVNIWMPTVGIGTISDVNGGFSISVDSCVVVNFSSVGYISQSKQITISNIDYAWDIRMVSDTYDLSEIKIKPDYSYDELMFKQVLKHKSDNTKNLKKLHKFGNYDRTTVLLATNEESKLQKILKVPDDVLVNDKDSVSYFPVYYAESLTDITNKEKGEEVDVVSKQKDGILPNLNEQIETLILEKVAFDFDFYKNQIPILDRGFISPLSNVALLYYNIYITDSINNNGIKNYKFEFYPKNKHAVGFIGHFWIEDKSFALINIDARLPEKANINFIKKLAVKVTYQKQPNGNWFYKDQKMNIEFALGSKTSINVTDTQSNRIANEGGTFHINRSLKYLLPHDSTQTINNVAAKDPFINTYTDLDIKTKKGIAKLKENKKIKCFDKIGDMFLSGYYTQGILEIGPIFDFYTTNYIEGHRFTLPIRTGEAFCKNFTVGGFLGYGTKNKKFKYGVSASYMLPLKTRTIISAKYSYDYANAAKDQYIRFIQENPYSRGNGNLISALTTQTRDAFVYEQERFEAELETDISNNIGLIVNTYYNRNHSAPYVQFKIDDKKIERFCNRGILMNFRFSFDRSIDEVYFARVYYGNTKPVINASFNFGQAMLPWQKSVTENFYALSNISIKHRFSIGPTYVRYMANIGYMIGNVPFTMLDKPYGTKSLGYSRYSYNLLGYTSFAHNLYTNLHINFNGGGMLFNHIPLISNLHLREMISLKCHYGTRTSQLHNTLEIPDCYKHVQKSPYVEMGFGITNIFKALRVEYVHVLGKAPIVNKYAAKHGIRMRFEVMF